MKSSISKSKTSLKMKKFNKADIMSILRKMPGGNAVENVREAYSDEDDYSSDSASETSESSSTCGDELDFDLTL